MGATKKDDSRFTQDEGSQWWWKTSDGTRLRCTPRLCRRCGIEFVSHRSVTEFCGHLCARHWRTEHPDEVKAPKAVGLKRERAPRWSGGYLNQRGYVLVLTPDHPSLAGTRRKYVAEHRLVMEQQLGRLLLRHERVHHKNGIKTDNRPENLELWMHGHPAGQRAKEHVPCIEIPVSLFLILLRGYNP